MPAAAPIPHRDRPRRIGTRDPEVVPLPTPIVAAGARAGVRWTNVLAVWLPVALILLLLDLTFPLWFWQIPKLTPRSADYGYQFLADAHRLMTRPRPVGTVQVLATGSSVAGSFDPVQVDGLLEAALPEIPVAVDRLLLPGIKPSDLRLFFATEGAALPVDIVFVLLNPLDFLNPSFERDLKPQVRYVLPPWQTLRERAAFIPALSDKLDLALASVSNLYRYRKLVRSSLEDHLRLAWRWVRAGHRGGSYGVFADGYTAQEFGVDIAADTIDLDYYVAPEWIAQQGRVRLRFATAAGPLVERLETRAGWKHLHAPAPPGHGSVLHVTADSAWSPRAAGPSNDVRRLGVRLRQAPPSTGRSPLHYPPVDVGHPEELLRMGGAQGEAFTVRWEAMLNADTAFGRRFRAYRTSKIAVRDESIDPQRGEYGELERLVTLLVNRGAHVVLVNTPESVLLRDQYETRAYYRSYIAYLQDLAARVPQVEFHDFRAALPPDDFNDWHHATYIGALKLGPAYAELARRAVLAVGQRGAGA